MLVRAFWFWFFFKWTLDFMLFQSSPKTGTFIAAGVSVAFAWVAAVLLLTADPKQCRRPPLIWPIALYLAWCFLSLAWTQAPLSSAFGYWVMTAAEVFTVYALARLTPSDDLLHDSLIGIISGACAVGFVGLLAGRTADGRIGNADFLHPNFIGHVAAIATIACLYLWLQDSQRRWLAIVGCLSVVMLLASSKTSLLALLIALAFLLRKRINFDKAALAVGVIVLAYFALAANHLSDYAEISTDPSSTLTGRWALWAGTVPLVLGHPAIGNGYASFHYIAPDLGDFVATMAHNELLQQWSTLGIVGLILAVLVYRSLLKQSRSPLWPLVSCLLLYFLIHGLTEADPYQTEFPLALIALVVRGDAIVA